MERLATENDDDQGLIAKLAGDGRPLIALAALFLIGCGAFALFQSATGHFLPHDTAYLGMTAQQLCELHGCRIVHFMMHDRVSFGGVLIAIGVMYLWLVEFPLRRRERWAWWALAISGGAGFLSFLAYLGYGYLDTWHGAGTLALLPIFVAGLVRTRTFRVRVSRPRLDLRSRAGLGRVLLLASTFGIAMAGVTISTVGATSVFVPQDLEFMRVTPAYLHSVNARLVPLIAHDRAGFGGGLLSAGLIVAACAVFANPSRSLWQALALAGAAGFGAAVGVHPAVGYTDWFHLTPAIAGSVLFVIGLALAASGRAEDSGRTR
jgi:hypothetical protein